MTTRERVHLAACTAALTVLALYTGAALQHPAGFVLGAVLLGVCVALLLKTPEDDQ